MRRLGAAHNERIERDEGRVLFEEKVDPNRALYIVSQRWARRGRSAIPGVGVHLHSFVKEPLRQHGQLRMFAKKELNQCLLAGENVGVYQQLCQ